MPKKSEHKRHQDSKIINYSLCLLKHKNKQIIILHTKRTDANTSSTDAKYVIQRTITSRTNTRNRIRVSHPKFHSHSKHKLTQLVKGASYIQSLNLHLFLMHLEQNIQCLEPTLRHNMPNLISNASKRSPKRPCRPKPQELGIWHRT